MATPSPSLKLYGVQCLVCKWVSEPAHSLFRCFQCGSTDLHIYVLPPPELEPIRCQQVSLFDRISITSALIAAVVLYVVFG